MKKVTRYVGKWGPMLSALVCLAVGGWWVRSYWKYDDVGLDVSTWPERQVWRGQGFYLRCVQGRWLFQWHTNEFHLDHPEGIVEGWGRTEAERYVKENPTGLKPSYDSGEVSLVAIIPPEVLAKLPPGVSFGRPDYLAGVHGWHGFGIKHGLRQPPTLSRSDTERFLMIPAWLPMGVLMIWPMGMLGRYGLRRRRRGAGLCMGCGYDLRASTGRCPECGLEDVSALNAGVAKPVSQDAEEEGEPQRTQRN
jgi:hypothetical protein